MRLGTIKRISKEDIGKSGESPKWLDALLGPLNEFIEKVGLALQSGLSFEDNFLCKVVSQKFTHGVELEINPSLTGKNTLRVTGALPLSGGEQIIDKFGWTSKANGNIGVSVYFDAGGTTEATCKILILLG